MCAILGLIDHRHPMEVKQFEAMLRTLAHRGPDGEGVQRSDEGRVLLGHRRLAIIDLSMAAAQPMPNEDETIWLTFNGEIYNYGALREVLEKKGHRFRSHSDTEVIVHGYEEWGTACVSRLRGIFAFGIWDQNERRLFLARDHFGVKPLYYAFYGGRFCFASQPKAIACDPAFHRAVDASAFSSYLSFGYVPRDKAIFRGMSKLPAGHIAVLADSRLTMDRYSSVHTVERYTNRAQAADAVAEKLEDAVRSQLVSEVPVGCFLSGGIDSSLLVSIATRTRADLRTFTMGFEEKASDERQFAAEVAHRFGTRHFAESTGRSGLEQRLWELQEYFDEPFDPNGPLPFSAVSELARRHDTAVCLGGDGGDELFAGYLRYDDFDCPASLGQGRGASVWRWLRRRGLAGLRSSSPGDLARYFAYEGCLPANAQRQALEPAFLNDVDSDEYAIMEPLFPSDIPAVPAAQRLDMELYLVDHILCKVDRASMAFGVEARVPFLDPELVRTVLSVSPEILYRRGERKALLKEVARRFLPRPLLTPRKKGFSSPMAAWCDAPLGCWANSLLDQSFLCEIGILRRDWRARLVPVVGEQVTGSRAWWLLLTAELWARRWLGGMAPDVEVASPVMPDMKPVEAA